MNNIEIRKKRKELGLTQEDLAKKLGVSLKTISNYEKGEVIPSSKQELLQEILNKKEELHVIKEPTETYNKGNGTLKKIEDIRENIAEREKIISFSTEQSIIEHQKQIIKLLEVQIEVLQKSIEDMIFEQKIINEHNKN